MARNSELLTPRSEDLVELFRPVVDNVMELIKEQAERTKAENEHPLSVSPNHY